MSEFETPPKRDQLCVGICTVSCSIGTKCEAFGPLSDPLMGLREELGDGIVEIIGSVEMEKLEGLQDPR